MRKITEGKTGEREREREKEKSIATRSILLHRWLHFVAARFLRSSENERDTRISFNSFACCCCPRGDMRGGESTREREREKRRRSFFPHVLIEFTSSNLESYLFCLFVLHEKKFLFSSAVYCIFIFPSSSHRHSFCLLLALYVSHKKKFLSVLIKAPTLFDFLSSLDLKDKWVFSQLYMPYPFALLSSRACTS